MAERNPDLEARIAANRDDLDAYLVYGDWLTEHDDPRGELIALQAKLLERPGDPELVKAEQLLLATHRKKWLGPLAGAAPKDVGTTWRLGFLDEIRLGPPLDEYATSEASFAELIAGIVELPGIDLLRRLTIGSKDHDDYPTEWNEEVHAIAEHGVPSRLERLELDCGAYWDISSTAVDLSRLYPRAAALRELRVRMGALVFGEIELPGLTSLEIVTGGLRGENIRAIAAARWPRLERLSLCIGETGNDYGCDVELADLAPIFDGANLEHVRHLGLANSSLADLIAAELAGSKILPRLSSLDLSKGTFGDDGARAILAHASRFRHLEVIDLTHHYVSPALRAELEALGPRFVMDDPQAPDEHNDREYRYVQISE